MQKTKKCPKCGETKDIEEFPLNCEQHRSYCRPCWNQLTKEYREQNPDWSHEFYLNNIKHKNVERCAKYREENRENIREYNRKYAAKQREERKDYYMALKVRNNVGHQLKELTKSEKPRRKSNKNIAATIRAHLLQMLDGNDPRNYRTGYSIPLSHLSSFLYEKNIEEKIIFQVLIDCANVKVVKKSEPKTSKDEITEEAIKIAEKYEKKYVSCRGLVKYLKNIKSEMDAYGASLKFKKRRTK